MNQMQDQLLKFKIQFNRARYTLLFKIIISFVNIFIYAFNGQLLMPFSSTIATYAIVLGGAFLTLNIAFFIVGCIVAAIILFALCFCYFKSKNNPMYLVVAMAITVVDIFALLSLIFFTWLSSGLLIDIAIHFVIIVYLRAGIKAHKEIKDLDEQYGAEDCENQITEDNEYDKPLGKYIDNGEPHLLEGSYKGFKVFVVKSNDDSELIINGSICDSLNVAYTDEYVLCAIVNGIEFNFEYKRSYDGETMFLYADDTLIDSFKSE